MEGDNIPQSDVTASGNIGDYRPEAEYRRSLISLRWLLIIHASYLTLFSHLSSTRFPILFSFSLLFTLSNVALHFVSTSWFESRRARSVINYCDIVFVTATFYLLRVPTTFLYLGFVLIFILAVIWRDLKLVLTSLLIVSLLFGVFSSFRFSGFALDVNFEQFLTLSLFFVVSIFYVFLAQQLARDARLSRAVLEEKRNAEIMIEITRGLSISLKTEDVLRVVVNRLSDVLNAAECSIIGIDPKTGDAQVMVRSSNSETNENIDLKEIPELREALDARRMVFRDVGDHSVVAVPMIAQNNVLGLIHVIAQSTDEPVSEGTIRFFEVMASTAGNALRNAQLFEEVEHRARTDFLTGLANHRYFQTTFSAEIGRAQRHNHPLSLLIIDLDYLKVVNDRFGHPTGDMVIRTVADTIRQSCREFDFAARYGGEEFTVILPETPLAGAISVADRIREKIAQIEFTGIGRITASVGIANYPLNALTKDELIRVADQALYVAKNGGRDRVAYFNYQLVTK
jgi:diguanylate cyclase (GGDEF)-like protein